MAMIDTVGQVSIAGPDVTSWIDYRFLSTGSNAVFLTPTTFNKSGVLFAFIVHCLNRSPVRLQVWRPTNISATYSLVCQRRVVPSIEQLYRRAVVS